MTIYLLGAFLLSLICGFVFTPIILDYCKRKKLYDIPNERKVHKNAIPRMGGISFFPSMITAFLVILLLLPVSEEHTLPVNLWSAIFMLGLLLIYITGIIDDLTGLNAKTKFAVQIFTKHTNAAILNSAPRFPLMCFVSALIMASIPPL